jgi:hypothetical protein
MEVLNSQLDLSQEPKFKEAMGRRTYRGTVYFQLESEPYMTLAVAGMRRDAGVSVAEVNLKFILDVVSQIKVGVGGRAYVVDAQGRLIAHPDSSLVLRNMDLSIWSRCKRPAPAADRPNPPWRPKIFKAGACSRHLRPSTRLAGGCSWSCR